MRRTLRGGEVGGGLDRWIAMRPGTFDAMDACYETLLHPRAGQPGLSAADRALAAWQAAMCIPHMGLGERYRAKAEEAGADVHRPSVRQAALLAHASRLATQPSSARPGSLDELRERGFGAREIIELSQVVAFVTYQARVLHGLSTWSGDV